MVPGARHTARAGDTIPPFYRPGGDKNAQGLWAGMAGGEFREEFTLPGEVDAEKANAEYHADILTVTLPKAEQTKVKTIKVGTHA